MHEVSGPPQQPSGVCGPGEIKGDSVRAVSGHAQVLLLEHSRKGGRDFNSRREWDREWQSSDTKMGGEEATVE